MAGNAVLHISQLAGGLTTTILSLYRLADCCETVYIRYEGFVYLILLGETVYRGRWVKVT
jgi:hypothetical protein